MKLEVGMYVRHKPLLSSKYVKINKIKEIEEKENCLYIWLEDKDLITEKYLIKASYNIIDILEVGDYVNGSKVVEVDFDAEEEKYIRIDKAQDGLKTILRNNDIKSIVTKKQFENMTYKVGE